MASRTLARLAEIAGDQWGLITRQQVQRAGIPLKTFDRLALEGAVVDRVAHGVYRLAAAPIPDYLDLRAVWLQLAPTRFVWERVPEEGVVSHRSAAALYGIGHLPADDHEFIVTKRKQTRRSDVRLHVAPIHENDTIDVRGLPVTLPSRTVADLLGRDEDPAAVAQVIGDAIRNVYDYPASFAERLAPLAFRFGLRRDDGLALLTWLLDLTGDSDAPRWIHEARTSDPQLVLGPKMKGVARPA
jgi:hypothetical protein